MRIAITGASGFVGSGVVPYLVSKNHEVLALCRSESSAAKARALGAEAVVLDLFEPEAVARTLAGRDAVVHMAARLEFFGPYADFQRDNVELTRILTGATRAAGVSRFIYVGAAAVVIGAPGSQPYDESTPHGPAPAGAYGTTKAIAETHVLEAGTDPELNTIVLRPPMVWGKSAPAFDAIADSVRSGQFMWIDGGHYSVGTIHVDNLAAAIASALDTPTATGTFFVTDGESIAFRDLVSAALQARGVKPPRMSLPRPVVYLSAWLMEAVWRLLRLKGAPPITRIIVELIGGELRVSDAKAREELGYTNRVSITEGLAGL